MKTLNNLRATFALGSLLILPVTTSWSAGSQMLHGHVPDLLKSIQPLGNIPAAKKLNLAISLPLRNREALTNLLQQIYDPTSPNYRHYLTPQQFANQFGPNETDYISVVNFAKSNHLTVTGTYPNRTLLDVSGTVADIEKTFHIKLRSYKHPTEARMFYAPDTEPSVDLTVPILEIAGLTDYVLPRPMYRPMTVPGAQNTAGKPAVGSGPGGTFMGNDFRSAYVPGVTLTGSGQNIGLFELDGYFTNDPVLYASQAGLTNAFAITNLLVDGFDGTPGSANVEVALDIEMVMSMAPGAQVMVYEGSTATPTIVIDILNRMANDDLAQELSSSWTYGTGPNMEQAYQQMDAQGQSFFNASGDYDAYSGTVTTPADDPYITIVGGTILSTGSTGSNWVSETAWNRGNGTGGGGGISTKWAIPLWQQGINMSASQGSTTMRNLPDVSMVAEAVYAVADNGAPQYLGGTSIATPLWAAFTALVNQKAALQGKQTVGFINPAIYAIGQGTNYNTAFHDITTGNNTNSSSPSNYFAVPGFDLCTGWGSPTPDLIDALLTVQFVQPTGWTLTSLPNEDWSSVASSADGSMFFAVDLSGYHQINVSSSSGSTWRSYGPAASWRGLVASADGTKLAAAAYSGLIYVSTNSGVTWAASTAPSGGWNSLASSADGSILAAAQSWSGSSIEVSTNSGASWTASQISGLYPSITALSADGSVLLAANGSVIYVSTNLGATSISVNLPGMNVTSLASSADGSLLYAAAGSLYQSTNRGASWTICGSLSGVGLIACSQDGYRIAAVSDQVYLSDDAGKSWIRTGPRTPPTYYGWSTIACSADGTRLIAAISDYYDGPVYTGLFQRSGPTITTEPANQTVVEGGTAVFSVVAVGPPPLTYQWSYNGTNISGATNSALVLNDVQDSQTGYYGVVVSDAYGSRYSPNASLSVVPPPVTIVTQPTNQTAVLGTTVSFAVDAVGTPPLSFQWLFNQANIPGATNSVFTLFNVQSNNAGTYAVTVANAYGPVTSSNAVLTLISSTPCLQPPAGLVSWWPAEGNATDRLGLDTGTTIGNVTYGAGYIGQCFVLNGNGAAIALANNSVMQLQGFTIEMWIKRASATLSSQSGGKAFLFAFGGYGFGLFDNGTLFWGSDGIYGTAGKIGDTNWHHVAVTATTTGDSIFVDGLNVGGSAWPQAETFMNVAIGARGDTFANSFYGAVDEAAFYNDVLSAGEIQAIYNAGAYGKCWLPAPPFILTQPAPQSVAAGGSATFSVTVAGWLQSLSYQWLFNGTNLVGMTNSSLLIKNAQQNQIGNYSVVVTNAYGSVTSSVVSLSVTGTSQYTAYPTNGLVPLTVQFNGPTADSAGNPILQWNWNFGDGATSTLQNPTHTYATVGSFSHVLMATNSLGFQVSSTGPAVTTSLPTCQYTASPTNGTITFTVQFTCPVADSGGNSIVQWNWNFGDGATSQLPNPTHIYATGGTFHPSLIATNNLNFTVVGSGPPVTAGNPVDLTVNGGFEKGDFTGWTLSGDTYWTLVDNGSQSLITPHSGNYEAALGTLATFGHLSQTLPTTPGGSYWLSFWLNHAGGDPNDIFMVSWNGTTLLAQTNPPAPIWTNYQFVVSATGGSTVLQFGFAASDIDYLDLDDVSLVALPPAVQPRITSISLAGSNLVINGTNGAFGKTYSILTATNMALPRSQWSTVATTVLNANGIFTLTATNAVNPGIQQAFYMLLVQ